MKKQLKLMSLLLSLTLLLISAAPLTANAFDSIDADATPELIAPFTSNTFTEPDKTPSQSIDEILIDYHTYIQSQKLQRSNSTYFSKGNTNNKEKTIERLKNAGYDAYSVSPETYLALEEELNTDFEAFNMDPNGSYIIVVSGEENGTRSTADDSGVPGVSFYHTSGGVNYYMRYFTITAEYDPLYAKASTVNLLHSKSREIIINCLDTAISLVISEFNPVLGVVASLCGLSVGDFATTQASTLDFYGGTNWTRVYTQVWNPDFEIWVNGACVEYVTASSVVCGQYYSAATNSYQTVPSNENSQVKRSSKYYDYTWRKDMAVYGATNFVTQYDCVGDVQYKYGNAVVITHLENF